MWPRFKDLKYVDIWVFKNLNLLFVGLSYHTQQFKIWSLRLNIFVDLVYPLN